MWFFTDIQPFLMTLKVAKKKGVPSNVDIATNYSSSHPKDTTLSNTAIET